MSPSQDEVARELAVLGAELEAAAAAQVGDAFTDDPDADAFLKSRPEIFLIGVLFTQGIPAERAWAAPWLLAQRLGHFDLSRLANEHEAVREALQQPPMLHRFKDTLPRWISSAASRLLADYGGDAARVWTPGSHVTEVTERLSAFDGIGRKKAAMTVEIVRRHFGARLVGTECGDVAYDVHVRRVFLRSGLVERDTPEEVSRAAGIACPEAPGSLDLAAWLVGREWCRPRSPDCDRCRLGEVCPRRTWLNVEGVGARKPPG